MSSSISRKLVDEYLETKRREEIKNRISVLTGREREIVQLLAEGQTSQAIGKVLSISRKTVQTHRKQMMKKLNVHRISDLVKYAVEEGLTGF